MPEKLRFSIKADSLPWSGILGSQKSGISTLTPHEASVITRLEKVQFRIVPSHSQPILIQPE